MHQYVVYTGACLVVHSCFFLLPHLHRATQMKGNKCAFGVSVAAYSTVVYQ